MTQTTSVLAALVDDVRLFADELPPEPAHWHRPAGPLRELLDFAGVDRMLTERAVRAPFLYMNKDGRYVPGERFLIGGRANGIGELASTTLIRGELAAGTTLVFNFLHYHWPPLAEACRRLGDELGMTVRGNAFLTPPRTRALDAHYDTDSVFVVQTEGTKSWQLFRPLLAHPVESQPWSRYRRSLPPERLRDLRPDHEIRLRPGDVLWIPRGWIHRAFAGDDASLHITLSVAETSRYRIADDVLREALADEESLRRDLPMRFARDRESAERAVREVLADLARWARRADVGELTDALLAAHRARFPRRPEPVTHVVR